MDRELQHIKTALQHCKFPSWALNQWQHKFTHPNQHNTTNNNSSADTNKTKVTIVVPYMPNTGEKFKKLCKKKGIQVHFKGTNTLRTALGNPKDKDPKNNQTGIIYHYQCPHINCPSAYIGESGRSLGERVKEHFKAPSPIHHHSTTTGHPMDPDQFNIVHKEVNSHSRTIKGSHVHPCARLHPRQEPGQVQAAAHMGPPPPGITHLTVQAFKPSNFTLSHLTPLLVPPTPPTVHYGGCTYFCLFLW